jgi:L-histidine N-alpha-methyltransferase
MGPFLQDVVKGLSSRQKYLQSKYFYDATGDELFQQIMNCPEYYLTKCEHEIFTTQTTELVHCLTQQFDEFDIVELGAGDATKSQYLLQELLRREIDFTYFPVDISSNVISLLHKKLPDQFPGLSIQGLNGEYFSMLEKAKHLSHKIKVVLFLGSNIGNVPLANAVAFCTDLRAHLNVGDLVLIGFDLQKDPATILAAYNDKAGITARFNFNLLTRINKELSGNFDPHSFSHYPTYDPGTGACKSYLVSQQDQKVEVADHSFYFHKYEPVFMEVSQKYTVAQTDDMAIQSGFIPVHHFHDAKHWFLDAIWQCV